MSEENKGNIEKYGNSEVVIQVYAKVSDLIRTEYVTSIKATEEVKKLLVDVKKNGFKDALKIKPDGLVMRGNTRCEVAEELGVEYLPIDLGFFVGIHTTDKENVMVLRKIIYDEEIDYINNMCRPVKEPTTIEYRKKVGFELGKKNYLINWSDNFMFLESHFEAVDVTHNVTEKKELIHLEELLNHWKGCEKSPTTEESCKWCHLLFNATLDYKEENKNE